MSSTDSVCVGCSRGCNTKLWVRNNEVLRLTPRFNPDVNEYWMCDYGRLETFKHVNAGTRIKAPLIRKDGKLTEVGWDEAIAKVAFELKAFKKHEIAAVGSAHATNEDNYLLAKLMSHLGVTRIDFMRHVVEGDEDDILLRADKTPNNTGAVEVGIGTQDNSGGFHSIINDIRQGTIRALYVIDDNVAADPSVAEALSKLDFLIVHASNEDATTNLADVILASSTYAEKHGTMTNFQGRVQRIRPAVATSEQDRSLDGFAMSRLDKFGAHNDRWAKGTRRDARPSWRILTGVAGALGARWKYASAEDVFTEISSTIDSFKGMSYLRIGSRGMMVARHTETVGKRA